MEKLTHHDLMSLEEYAVARSDFRQYIMTHKKYRLIPFSQHARLLFEDRETIQYQMQEMLHLEKIFTATEIQEELENYNALIPDGQNLKASFILEYPDPPQWSDLEKKIWLQIGTCEKVHAICDTPLAHHFDQKTLNVHCLRFELTTPMCIAIKNGAPIQAGIEHHALETQLLLSEPMRQALAADIDIQKHESG